MAREQKPPNGGLVRVLIFRHQLFKASEPFVAQQALACRDTEAVFLGKVRLGEAPPGSRSLTLDQLPGQRRPFSKLWQAVTRDPRPYRVLLEGMKPSLIHAHFGVEGVYALKLARNLNVPLITTFHGFDATLSIWSLLKSRSPSWINYALFRRQLARQGDLFICVSEFIREKVVRLGFPSSRTQVHYIGVDTDTLRPRDPDGEKPMLLHVARLVEKKGTEYLIRAFARISQADHPDLRLSIIGEGPRKKSLQVLAEALGVNDRITFLGARPNREVLDVMRTASMLVIPSVTAKSGDAEGLPMVLLEAAALGLPVIGSLHGGIAEAIRDGETGYLIPERDVDLLKQRITTLMDDRELRISMGRNARQLMETSFNSRRQAEILEAMYERVSK